MGKRSFCIKNRREDHPDHNPLGKVMVLRRTLSIMNGVILFT